MIGEKLIFCALNAVFIDWAGVCVEFFIHSDHLLSNCYIQYITVNSIKKYNTQYACQEDHFELQQTAENISQIP